MDGQMKPPRTFWKAVAVAVTALLAASLAYSDDNNQDRAYTVSEGAGRGMIGVVLDAIASIGKEIYYGLKSLLTLNFYLITHPSLNNPNVSSGPYLQLSGAIMSIIIPVIAFAVLLAAGKMVLAAENPGERAQAKSQLHNLLVGLVIIPFSPHMYKLVLDVNHMLTIQLLGCATCPPGVYQSMVGGESLSSALLGSFSVYNPGQFCIILMLAYAVNLLAVGMIMLRHILIVLFGVLMPLTCFLYLFDFTKTLGRKFLKYSITWAFVPVAMSVWIIIAGIVLVNIGDGVDRNNGVFLAIVFLAGIVMAPLIVTGAMETMGAAVTAAGQLQGGALGTGMVAAGQLMQAQSGEALMMASLNAASKATMGGLKGVSSGVKSLAGGATGQGGKNVMSGNLMGASGQGGGLSSAAGKGVEAAGNAAGSAIEGGGRAGGTALQSAGQAGIQAGGAASATGVGAIVGVPAIVAGAGATAGGAGVQAASTVAGQSIKAASKVAGKVISKVGGAAEKIGMKGLKQAGGKALKGTMGAAGGVAGIVAGEMKKGMGAEAQEGEKTGMAAQVSSAMKSAKGGKKAGTGLFGKLREADKGLGNFLRGKIGLAPLGGNIQAAGTSLGGRMGGGGQNEVRHYTVRDVKTDKNGEKTYGKPYMVHGDEALNKEMSKHGVDKDGTHHGKEAKLAYVQKDIKDIAPASPKASEGATATGVAKNIIGGMIKGSLATTLVGVATLGTAGALPALVGLAIGGYSLMKGTGLGRGIGNTIKNSTQDSAFFKGMASKGLVNTAAQYKSLGTAKERSAFRAGKMVGLGVSMGIMAAGWLALRAPLLGVEFAMSGGTSLPIRAGRSLWKAPGAISKGVGTLREAYNTYKDTSTPETGMPPGKAQDGTSAASGAPAGAAPGKEAAKDAETPATAQAAGGGQQAGGEKPAETTNEPGKEQAGAAGQKAEPAAGAQKAGEAGKAEPGKSAEDKAKDAEKEKPQPQKDREEREKEHEKYEKMKELMTGSFKGHQGEKKKSAGEQLEEMLNDGD